MEFIPSLPSFSPIPWFQEAEVDTAVHLNPVKKLILSEETYTVSTYSNNIALSFLPNWTLQLEAVWTTQMSRQLPGELLAPLSWLGLSRSPSPFCCQGDIDSTLLLLLLQSLPKERDLHKRGPWAHFWADIVSLVLRQHCVWPDSQGAFHYTASSASGVPDSSIQLGLEPIPEPSMGDKCA